MTTKPPTREQITKAFENANLGSADPVEMVQSGLLKYASGYHAGHTVRCVLQELGLLRKNSRNVRATPKLTKRGGFVLYEWCRPTASQQEAANNKPIDIVFDGPPSQEMPRFVEVEDGNRRSVDVGEWLKRDDGYWVLRLRGVLIEKTA